MSGRHALSSSVDVVAIAPRAVLTPAGGGSRRRTSQPRRDSVAGQARAFGVGWRTIMGQVHERGRPVVEDPARLDGCSGRRPRFMA